MDSSYKTINLTTIACKKILETILSEKTEEWTQNGFSYYPNHLLTLNYFLEHTNLVHLEHSAFTSAIINAMLQSPKFLHNEKLTIKLRYRGLTPCANHGSRGEDSNHKTFENTLKIGNEKTAHFVTKVEALLGQTDVTMVISNGIPHEDDVLAEIYRIQNNINVTRLVDFRLAIEYQYTLDPNSNTALIFKSSNSESIPKKLEDYFSVCFKEIVHQITQWNTDEEDRSKICHVTYPWKPVQEEEVCPCEASESAHFIQRMIGQYPMCNILISQYDEPPPTASQ